MVVTIKLVARSIAALGAGFALVLAGTAMAQAVSAPPPPPASAAAVAPPASSTPVSGSTDEGYILGPGDVVEIVVLGREEFRPRVQVQVDGTIQLPYLHSVKAADLSVIQLRNKVTGLLREGGYYTDPVVNVAIAAYASRYVTVLGEFGSPGLVPVDRAYRVSEILARAGGARAGSSDDILLRRANGAELRLPVRSVARGGPDDDPFVQPGDKLYLPSAPIYYIYGQVGAPGAYKVERGMTVRMALARGGGLTDRGSAGKVAVYRSGRKIKVNMDTPLIENDTIHVGERFF